MELLRAPADELLLSAAAASPWTWVAVLTAAFGLWRIRAVGSRYDSPPSPTSTPPSPVPPAPSALTAWLEENRPEEEFRMPKERFTVFYPLEPTEENGDCSASDYDEFQAEEEEVAGGGDGGKYGNGEFWSPLERSEWMGLGVRRRADFGWYRYQDRTAINGSVVRLWRVESKF